MYDQGGLSMETNDDMDFLSLVSLVHCKGCANSEYFFVRRGFPTTIKFTAFKEIFELGERNGSPGPP